MESAMYRILAVAVGPENGGFHIATPNPANVRPYIYGLIDGLLFGYQQKIGNHYDIWYRECPLGTKDAYISGDKAANDLIFPMSTRVLNDAIKSGIAQPIVCPTVSDFQKDVANNVPQNVAGINAQRDQGNLLIDFFSQAWPPLQTLYYLHLAGYGPSERAKGTLEPEAKALGIHLNPLTMTKEGDLNGQLNKLAQAAQDGHTGLLVLPIDFCLGEASTQAPHIIQIANQYDFPVFFPIPDWAYQTAPGGPAFGGYGVSQYICGKLASDLIYPILWKGASPGGNIVLAPASLFELVVNQTAANDLGIRLSRRLQRQVRP
jgi:ABC-type uncharacterized transport system substrate-binding protein